MEMRGEVIARFGENGASLSFEKRYKTAVSLDRDHKTFIPNEENQFVSVPAGLASIGAQSGNPEAPNFDPHAGASEAPVHTAFSAGFEISKFPISVQEFKQFVDSGGYEGNYRGVWEPNGWAQVQEEKLKGPEDWAQQMPHPKRVVVGVSWYEASAFCQWLSQGDSSFDYCLPTESEWEYAARQGVLGYIPYCASGHYQRS